MKKIFYLLIPFLIPLLACGQEKNLQATDLKVLQINIWQEGTIVYDGFNILVNQIVDLDPDLVTFSEVRNYNGRDFIPRLTAALKLKGKTYYGQASLSTGIISKYKIEAQEVVYPLVNDRGSVLKARIQIGEKQVVLYSAHLDWLDYACYLPRGYDGNTWKKLEAPVVDTAIISANNRDSYRDEQIKKLIDDASKEINEGSIILIGGDFNEPSHLDWQENTKEIRDHNGVVLNWDCSILLEKSGYKDCYREQYPDPMVNPGFTFPSANPLVEPSKLSWAPDADERDRIDFIYYYPNPEFGLKEIQIVGPSQSILYGKSVENDSEDRFILPKQGWPTDHKALLGTFQIKK